MKVPDETLLYIAEESLATAEILVDMDHSDHFYLKSIAHSLLILARNHLEINPFEGPEA